MEVLALVPSRYGYSPGQRSSVELWERILKPAGIHLTYAPFETERLREVLNFAEFLSWQEERQAWRQFGQAQLARAYGPNEPEYTTADLKPELNS